MTEEEKTRLDVLANTIIEDSERVTLSEIDTQIALHTEIARLRAKCERYRQCLIKINQLLEYSTTKIDNALGDR